MVEKKVVSEEVVIGTREDDIIIKLVEKYREPLLQQAEIRQTGAQSCWPCQARCRVPVHGLPCVAFSGGSHLPNLTHFNALPPGHILGAEYTAPQRDHKPII